MSAAAFDWGCDSREVTGTVIAGQGNAIEYSYYMSHKHVGLWNAYMARIA
jgi:hypothetical protein